MVGICRQLLTTTFFSSAAVPHNGFCGKSVDGQQDLLHWWTAKLAYTTSLIRQLDDF